MKQDLKHALQILLRHPRFTAVAVLTLALGIGANTAIFTLVHSVLLRPLPYPEAERVARLWERTDRGPRVAFSRPNFRDLAAMVRGFESVGAYTGGRETVIAGKTASFADAYLVSEGFFKALGVEPSAGRTFAREETTFGGPPAAIVSYDFWRQTLGEASLEQARVEVAGLSCQVVGVLPPGTAYPRDADVWIPEGLFEDTTSRTAHNLNVIGRIRRGVSFEEARAELQTIAAGIKAQHGDSSDAVGITTVTLHESLSGGSRPALLMLLAAVALVLLIACANVASTLLARAEERRRELAIRAALGASRRRLVRQLLVESALLALVGGTAGFLAGGWMLRALLSVDPGTLTLGATVGIDARAFAFSMATALGTVLVFGLLPALRASRVDLRDSLVQGGRGVSAGGSSRTILIGVEAALATLLLVGASLLIRSLWTVTSIDPGYDPGALVTLETTLPGTRYDSEEKAVAFYGELLQRLHAVPGVRHAGLTSSIPLDDGDAGGSFRLDSVDDRRNVAGYRVVSADYLRALAVPLVKGRFITDEDDASRETVAVVNEAFVRQYLGSGDPIGRRFQYYGMDSRNDPWLTIVGVVGDVRHRSLVADARPEAFVSYKQLPKRTRYTVIVAVRLAQADLAERTAPALTDTVRSLGPEVPVEIISMEQRIAASVADRRFTAAVFGAFGAAALLLAAVGIYGVLSHAVARRMHEIGIRLALGAEPRAVVRMVRSSALKPVAVGILIGAIGALAAGQLIASLLYGVQPADPRSFIVAAAALLSVAWLAASIPARRATSVDPNVVLRTE
jgi:predicted permease